MGQHAYSENHSQGKLLAFHEHYELLLRLLLKCTGLTKQLSLGHRNYSCICTGQMATHSHLAILFPFSFIGNVRKGMNMSVR